MAKKPDLAHIEKLIARNKTRVKAAMTRLEKLERQRRRLLAKTLVGETIDKIAKAFPPAPVVTHVTVHPANIESAMLYGKTQTMGVVHAAEPVQSLQLPSPTVGDGLGIPDFLKRQDAAAADAVKAEQADIDIPVTMKPDAVEELRAELAERKKAKARGRIAKLKAKKSGDTKKMPLTGKAALALINNG